MVSCDRSSIMSAMVSSRSESTKSTKSGNSVVVGIGGLQRPGPSEISYKGYRLLITDRPTDATLPFYVEELKKRQVTDVVRVCEPTYQTELLEKEDIKVHEMQFDDGSSPVPEIVEDWLHLIKNRFREKPEACVAVHCVAGLGRAPVLVALALVELGMQFEDAVEYIRSMRRGALNSKQLSYLEKYRSKNRLKRSKVVAEGRSNWLASVARKIYKK